MKKNILFYSSVIDKELFDITGFYSTDIRILRELGFNVKTSNSIFDFIKFWKYDIAFIYFWTKGLIPAIISKLFFKKVLFTGGIDRLDISFNESKIDIIIRRVFFKLCTFFSDASIVVSKSDLQNTKKIAYKLNSIHYLPHVIDFEKYKYNGENKSDYIVSIVWMETSEMNVIRKGVDKLLFVFNEYLKLDNKLKIIIIGSKGIGSDYLLNIGEELGIKDKIEFTGRISENRKIEILKSSKFYFQLSIYEGFGIAAIEALAAGNIVFHSGRGGLKDAISAHGILIEDTSDYKSIAETLFQLDTNYEQNFKNVKNGILYVQHNFSFEKRLTGISSILENLNVKK